MILAAAEELAEDSEARVRVKVALVLQGMTIRGWFGQRRARRIAQLAMTRLSDPCSHARARSCMCLAPRVRARFSRLALQQHRPLVMPPLSDIGCFNTRQTRRPALAPTHVKRFLEYVLSTANCAGARPPVSWLPDVFDGYGRQLAVARGPMAPNARVVGVWAAWECARACVCARLRTHLGGPAQTFAAFERSLVGGATSSIRGETGLGERQQALVSMLVFLDALEQHIYSASSGCFRSAVAMDDSGMLAVNSSSASAFRLPPPSQSAELFFRTNQKVCEEWLARIRPRALSASVVCGATMDTVRHGLLRANDVSRQLLRLPASAAPTDARRVLRDFDACMAPLLSALAKLRERYNFGAHHVVHIRVRSKPARPTSARPRTTTGSKPCCSCLAAHTSARSSSVSRCFPPRFALPTTCHVATRSQRRWSTRSYRHAARRLRSSCSSSKPRRAILHLVRGRSSNRGLRGLRFCTECAACCGRKARG